MKRLDIISSSSPEFCCGALAPRQGIQVRIDRMQDVIDQAHQLLNYGDVPQYIVDELKKELEKLSSD